MKWIRRYEREESTEVGAGGGTPAPAAAPAGTVLSDVMSVIKDIEGQGSAPETPAPEKTPAAPPAAAAPAANAPEDKVTPPPPASTKTPYTQDEIAAFDGNYDRRDFDWERVPPEHRAYAKHLASGTGKYRARLKDEVRAELEAQLKTNPTAAGHQQQPGAPKVDPTAAFEKFVNAQDGDTAIAALGELLTTDSGKALMTQLGYTDPVERGVVGELVHERILERGLLKAKDWFPQITEDPSFTAEVNDFISQSPKAIEAMRSRDDDEVTGVLSVAAAYVVSKRQAAQSAALSGRESQLSQREAAIAAREADLTKQIEATNRTESKQSAIVKGSEQGSENRESSILDDVKEIGGKAGLWASR